MQGKRVVRSATTQNSPISATCTQGPSAARLSHANDPKAVRFHGVDGFLVFVAKSNLRLKRGRSGHLLASCSENYIFLIILARGISRTTAKKEGRYEQAKRHMFGIAEYVYLLELLVQKRWSANAVGASL